MADDDKKRPPGWPTIKPVVVQQSELGSRIGNADLKVEEYDKLIRAQGVRVHVYRTMACPNIKSIDGAEHEIDCELCRNGFVDIAPISTMAFLQSQTSETTAHESGYYDAMAVDATFLRGVDLQYFTLIELCDFTEIFWQPVKRSRGDVDVLKYRATHVNVVVDSRGKQYYQGNDFTIDQNGCIKWLENRGPSTGTIYAAHYYHRIQFRAQKAMHVNRFGQKNLKGSVEMVKMNEQWRLAREFFVTRVDAQGNALSPNLIRDEDE